MREKRLKKNNVEVAIRSSRGRGVFSLLLLREQPLLGQRLFDMALLLLNQRPGLLDLGRLAELAQRTAGDVALEGAVDDRGLMPHVGRNTEKCTNQRDISSSGAS